MVTRYLAPGAVLLGVTAVVLAIHYGVQQRPTRKAATTTVHLVTRRSPAPAIAVDRFYVVQRGDSFSAIAVKTRTSVARLERLNPGVSSTALHVGQRIRVK